MKFPIILLSALSWFIVSCERHEMKDTAHLYEEHAAHGADHGTHGAGHGDDHKEKSSAHGDNDHGKAAH